MYSTFLYMRISKKSIRFLQLFFLTLILRVGHPNGNGPFNEGLAIYAAWAAHHLLIEGLISLLSLEKRVSTHARVCPNVSATLTGGVS